MFTLDPLPYDYKALEPYIDEETMHIHHDKHHQTYVDNLNKALENFPELQRLSLEGLLSDLNKIPEEIRTKVRNSGGGVYNHNLFWTMMAPASAESDSATAGKPPAGSEIAKAIDGTFGDFGGFKEQLGSMAIAHFGSGWAWLVADGGKLKLEDSNNQDAPLSLGHIPILGVDVWEHAYYLKYQNRRKEYIEAWWHIVSWPQVERNLLAAIK